MNYRSFDLSRPDDALWVALAGGDEAAATRALDQGARPEARRPVEWNEEALNAYTQIAREALRFHKPLIEASALEAAAFWRMPETVEKMLASAQQSLPTEQIKKALAAALSGSLPFREQKEAAAEQDRIADMLLSALPQTPWAPVEDFSANPAAPIPSDWCPRLLREWARKSAASANWVSWRWLKNKGAFDYLMTPSIPLGLFPAAHEPQIAALIAAQWPEKSVDKIRRAWLRQQTEDAPGDPWSGQARALVSESAIETIEALARHPHDEKKWMKAPTRLQMSQSIAMDVAAGDAQQTAKKIKWWSDADPEKFTLNLSDVFSFLWDQGGPSALAAGKDASAGWELAVDACAELSERDWHLKRSDVDQFARRAQTEFWQKAFFHARVNEAESGQPTPFSVGEQALRSQKWSALSFWVGFARHSRFQEGKIAWRESEAALAKSKAVADVVPLQAQQAERQKYEAQDRAIALAALGRMRGAIEACAQNEPQALFDATAMRFAKKGLWFGLMAIFESGFLADPQATARACLLEAIGEGHALAAEKIIERDTPLARGMLRDPDEALRVAEALERGERAHETLLAGKGKKTKKGVSTTTPEEAARIGDWSRLVARVEAISLSASLDAISRQAAQNEVADSEARPTEKTRRL